jgi:hypothetical protein
MFKILIGLRFLFGVFFGGLEFSLTLILGTETWLDKDTSSYEFFPSELFNVYRSDRKPNKNNQSYGGVLIAIKKEFISY